MTPEQIAGKIFFLFSNIFVVYREIDEFLGKSSIGEKKQEIFIGEYSWVRYRNIL